MKFALILSIILSCTNNPPPIYTPEYGSRPIDNRPQYIFGIHPLHNPQKLQEIFGPMIDYIDKELPNANITLEASRNYASFDQKLYTGKLSFALPNPYQTVKSLKQGYKVIAKMGDDYNFRGIIIVRKDGPIKKIPDLIGKIVSYPAPTALAATMMPQFFLQENGINVEKDLHNHYVGSQESAIMNVYLKSSIAGATWPPPWKTFQKERPQKAQELSVIWETKPFINNGVVARKDIPKEITAKVQEIIIHMHKTSHGKKILKKMELSKFEKASNKHYLPVLKFIDKFHNTVRKIK